MILPPRGALSIPIAEAELRAALNPKGGVQRIDKLIDQEQSAAHRKISVTRMFTGLCGRNSN